LILELANEQRAASCPSVDPLRVKQLQKDGRWGGRRGRAPDIECYSLASFISSRNGRMDERTDEKAEKERATSSSSSKDLNE
jgi:hypothetical protein